MGQTERLCDLREIKKVLNLKENTVKSLEYCGGILFHSKRLGSIPEAERSLQKDVYS